MTTQKSAPVYKLSYPDHKSFAMHKVLNGISVLRAYPDDIEAHKYALGQLSYGVQLLKAAYSVTVNAQETPEQIVPAAPSRGQKRRHSTMDPADYLGLLDAWNKKRRLSPRSTKRKQPKQETQLASTAFEPNVYIKSEE